MLRDPRMQIFVGLVLTILGVILPLLMVMDVIRASLLLSILSHVASVGGLFLGYIGILTVIRSRRD
jgi:hypothetical protein